MPFRKEFIYIKITSPQTMKEFFEPKSIAVIGASRNRGKVGNAIFRNLLRSKAKVYPINIKAKKVEGRKAYDKVFKVDLAIIAIPAPYVPQVLEECGKVGVKHAIIISAGFSEVGRKDLSEEVLKIVRKYGIRVVGPNCLGIVNTRWMNATFFEGMPEKGGISIISQSGALGVALLDRMIEEGIGLSKFISVGNMLDLGIEDFVEYLNGDRDTKVIALYVESLKRGRKFLEVVKRCEKPVVVLKAGRGEAGKKAASSHTGAMAGSFEVYDGVFRQYGLKRVDDVNEFFKLSQVLEKRTIKGKKVVVVTNAGGPGVLAADACEHFGMKMVKLPKEVIKELNSVLPSAWSHNNPIDIIGDARAERYKKVFETLSKYDFYDLLLCILTPQMMTEPEKTAVELAKLSRKKRCFACFMGGEKVKGAKKLLKRKGVLNFEEPWEAFKVLSKLS